MTGNLQMGNNRITGLTNQPEYLTEATNKMYVDSAIKKGLVKPSHTAKNVFEYVMKDILQFSEEYGVNVLKIADLAISPHFWDKKCLYLSPVKRLGSYIWRIGIQCFALTKNHDYTLVIELYNKDLLTYNKTNISLTGTGMAIEGCNTHKYSYQYQRAKFLYYTKTLIHFKKTTNNPPVFIYYTVHCGKQGNDLDKYLNVFKDNVYLVAYDVDGITSHVDSDVYDAHKAFELEKTQGKYFILINMNNKKITNVLLDINDNTSIPTIGYLDTLRFINDYLYRKYFERYYDFLSGGDYYVTTGTSGVIIQGMDPNLLFQNFRFGITNVTTNGFKLNTAEGNPIPLRIHSLSTDNTNFTLGVVLYLDEIDKTNEGITPLEVRLGSKLLFGILRSTRILNFYSLTSSNGNIRSGSCKDVIDALRNKTVICWLCKNQKLLKFDLSNYSAETIATHDGETPVGGEITISIYSPYVKRIFYSPNFYDIDSRAHHEILIQEKLKGTTIL